MQTRRKAFFLPLMLAVALTATVRVRAVSEIAIESASPILPGIHVRLAVPTAVKGKATYTWSATSGHFRGATDRSSVVFVAPATGSTFITRIEEAAGRQHTYNRRLFVQQSAPARLQQPASAPPAGTVTPYDIGRGGFVPSGWMGDYKGVKSEANADGPADARGSRRWTWTPVKSGPGWVAVAYQYPDKNWGDRPGRDLSGKGYRELSVWARGVPDKAGHLPVVQFKTGGATDPTKKFQASFEAEADFVELTKEWKRYSVPVVGKDLSRVISAFTFVLRADDHPLGAEIFLAQIEFR